VSFRPFLFVFIVAYLGMVQVKENFRTFSEAIDYIDEATRVYKKIKGNFTYDFGFEGFGRITVIIKPVYGVSQDKREQESC
jgi:hypothetical protein